ncbi:MAG: Sir2 family NAD-dependent protein deacetylase [Desulfobacterales bacterium]|jgi:NAD-dependent deacetylase
MNDLVFLKDFEKCELCEHRCKVNRPKGETFREDPSKYWTIRNEFIRNTVLFGEQLPQGALEKAYQEASNCKLMLVIGTSAVVQPAASLPAVAQQKGAKIVEVNIEPAFPTADIVVKEEAGVGLSNILEAVRRTYAQGQPRGA